MKLKEKIKRFWTLDVHNHEGFTLVELIIVIAILSILSSVGVVGYSSYVTKANKQADITPAAEIENALMLAFYSEGFSVGSATVVLTTEKAFCTDGTTTIENAADAATYLNDANNKGTALACALKAMSNAYSDSWFAALELKYDGWEINSVSQVVEDFNKSTYNGSQNELLGTVQALTNSFEAIVGNSAEVSTLLGSNYTEYLKNNNISTTDNQAVANSAVAYVASRTNVFNSTQKAAFVAAWTNPNAVLATFQQGELATLGLASAMAALCAKGEAVVRYLDSKSVAFENHSNPSDTTVYPGWSAWFTAQQYRITGATSSEIASNLNAVYLDLVKNVQNNTHGALNLYANDYSANQAAKDAEAYLGILGMIDDSSSVMMDNLGSDNLYGGSVVPNLLNPQCHLYQPPRADCWQRRHTEHYFHGLSRYSHRYYQLRSQCGNHWHRQCRDQHYGQCILLRHSGGG